MLKQNGNIYDILGIDRNADTKTIKKAYAKLVKRYHPEENPEEWKRIHDAYELAMRNASVRKQYGQNAGTSKGTYDQPCIPHMPMETYGEALDSDTPTDSYEQEIQAHTLTKSQENELETFFGEIERLAYEQQEAERKSEREKCDSAIKEIQWLIWRKKVKLDEWKAFFDREDMLPIFSQKKFLKELGDCLKQKKIDDKLYTYLNGQLDRISDYLMTGSININEWDLSSVKYARVGIETGHNDWKSDRTERKDNIRHCVAAVLFILFLFVSGFMIPKQEREKRESEEQYEETIPEITERQQKVQNIIESSQEMSKAMQQQFQKMLKEDEMMREEYFTIIKRSDLDRIESGETESGEIEFEE